MESYFEEGMVVVKGLENEVETSSQEGQRAKSVKETHFYKKITSCSPYFKIPSVSGVIF